MRNIKDEGEVENGHDICPISHEWFNHRAEAKKAMEQINTMHGVITAMLMHTAHLEKLDSIAQSRERELEILKEVKGALIEPATGKNHTDNETVKLIVKILGGVILALLFVLVFLLTGQKFGIFPLH